MVPAPCSLSLQAAGRCRDNAALGEVGKAPQILELLRAPGLSVWGCRRRYKRLGEGRSRRGTSFMSRRQRRRDKEISGDCLQGQDSSKKLVSLMAPA